MLGISLSEFLLILVVALIVLGPKQLPRVATRFGLFIYVLKKYISGVREDLYYKSGVHELVNTKSELMTAYSNIHDNIRGNVFNDSSAMFSSLEELHQPELDFDCQPELFDELRTN